RLAIDLGQERAEKGNWLIKTTVFIALFLIN
ncbi:MAG: hypothetical protein ACD_9C00250G0002, partial [uncultured bacterium]